jgi:alkaline phosphatase D
MHTSRSSVIKRAVPILLSLWSSASGAADTIVFGSCLRQWQPAPILDSMIRQQPRAVLLLGDNVYNDVGWYLLQPEPQRIGSAYSALGETAEYQRLQDYARTRQIPIHAVWDDHDYGANDGGADYVHRLASKTYFTDFFGITNTVTGPAEPGIYRAESLQIDGLTVQILLLDTRSFRSPLHAAPTTPACPRSNTGPNTDPDATVLGEAQWQWLQQALQAPADLRLLVSSIQLLPFEHCYEKWANFPRERQRLLDLISSTRANGVIILSGDRHLAEISVLTDNSLPYPLWEITSSGLNSAIGSERPLEPNSLRAGSTNMRDHNFGSITLTTHPQGARVIGLNILNAQGEVVQHQTIALTALNSGTASTAAQPETENHPEEPAPLTPQTPDIKKPG